MRRIHCVPSLTLYTLCLLSLPLLLPKIPALAIEANFLLLRSKSDHEQPVLRAVSRHLRWLDTAPSHSFPDNNGSGGDFAWTVCSVPITKGGHLFRPTLITARLLAASRELKSKTPAVPEMTSFQSPMMPPVSGDDANMAYSANVKVEAAMKYRGTCVTYHKSSYRHPPGHDTSDVKQS